MPEKHPTDIQESNFEQIILKKESKDITDSYVRTWIDRDAKPYKYEFRGENYIGYHNPDELIIEVKCDTR